MLLTPVSSDAEVTRLDSLNASNIALSPSGLRASSDAGVTRPPARFKCTSEVLPTALLLISFITLLMRGGVTLRVRRFGNVALVYSVRPDSTRWGTGCLSGRKGGESYHPPALRTAVRKAVSFPDSSAPGFVSKGCTERSVWHVSYGTDLFKPARRPVHLQRSTGTGIST